VFRADFSSGAAQNADEFTGSAKLCGKARRKIRQKMGVERQCQHDLGELRRGVCASPSFHVFSEICLTA
jgi:hypothetical protein